MSDTHIPSEKKVRCELCAECGMPVFSGEYHPYAACLMFRTCKDSEVVARNLEAVLEHGRLGVKKRLGLNREVSNG